MNQKPQLIDSEKKKEEQVPVHGFQQVLEMLRIADPAFRESLLKRLASRDLQLAKTLRNDLADMGL
jgi:hypothetical protein